MNAEYSESVYEPYLHPLTFAAARVAVGSSSVCQPVTAACIVPAPPAAACAAAMPGHESL